MERTVIDMTGREVGVVLSPQRIVSLVPSQTELLYYLGLQDEVIGITKFCVHPEKWFREKKRIGGTKSLHLDVIKGLRPDLILANKEENNQEQIEELAKSFPVWVSDITTVNDAMCMIRNVGVLTGTMAAAIELDRVLKARYKSLNKNPNPKKVAYFIWRDPWMSVGGDTFISDMISRMGWVNVLANKFRYPHLDMGDIASLDVDLILLSSEPYPFKEQHIAEIKAVLPNVEVKLVDGEMFSWYGNRMLQAVDYLKELAGELVGR
jgi:ABC-type Fe3+-hydroxamate transport system substrate-binding protein